MGNESSQNPHPTLRTAEALALIVLAAFVLACFGGLTAYLSWVEREQWAVAAGIVSGAGLVMLLVGLKEWRRGLKRDAPPPASADRHSVWIVD